MEKEIPDLIIQKSTIGNGYTHYNCWFDIEPTEFVYVYLIAYNDKITLIEIFPHHSSPKPTSFPDPDEDHFDIIKEWYYKYFDSEKQSFPWGIAALDRGTDILYHPSQIVLKYDR